MQVYVNPRINEDIYLKDPIQSDLGKKIIFSSVNLVNTLGFDKFNFKKLGAEIKSTEASIYRYFPNKERLLIYLSAWYWETKNYLIVSKTNSITDPREKLTKAIKALVNVTEEMQSQNILELHQLQAIVTQEFYKITRTKRCSSHNESGYFESFKRLCTSISDIIKEIDPDFKYPITMATSLIEMSISNNFCSSNLPSLTEIQCGEDKRKQIEDMMTYFCERLLVRCKK